MYLIAVLDTASELFKSEHLAAVCSTRQTFCGKLEKWKLFLT